MSNQRRNIIASISSPTGTRNDLAWTLQPENMATLSYNLSFRNGYIQRVNGYSRLSESLFDDKSYFNEPIKYLKKIHMNDETDRIIVFTTNKAYSKNSSNNTFVDISGANYAGDNYNQWSVVSFMNEMFSTNSNYVPQVWDGNNSSNMTDLPVLVDGISNGLPTGFKARIVESFNNMLMWFNTYDGTSWYPTNVYYSAIGDARNYLTSTDSGGTTPNYFAITTGGDEIVAVKQISSYLAIYKAHSIYLLSYTGDSLVFDIHMVIKDRGSISMNSVVALQNMQYFASSNENGIFDGFYTFDGTSTQPIPGMIGIYYYLRNNINYTYIKNTIGFYSPMRREIIWLFPSNKLENTNGYTDIGVIYNIEYNTWSLLDYNYKNNINNNFQTITSMIEYNNASYTDINSLTSTIDELIGNINSLSTFNNTPYNLYGSSNGSILISNDGYNTADNNNINWLWYINSVQIASMQYRNHVIGHGTDIDWKNISGKDSNNEMAQEVTLTGLIFHFNEPPPAQSCMNIKILSNQVTYADSNLTMNSNDNVYTIYFDGISKTFVYDLFLNGKIFDFTLGNNLVDNGSYNNNFDFCLDKIDVRFVIRGNK